MMQEHMEYWRNLANKRIAVVVGPVADPKGLYGLAVVEVQDEAAVQDIRKNDPAFKADAGFKIEIYSMVKPVLRK